DRAVARSRAISIRFVAPASQERHRPWQTMSAHVDTPPPHWFPSGHPGRAGVRTGAGSNSSTTGARPASRAGGPHATGDATADDGNTTRAGADDAARGAAEDRAGEARDIADDGVGEDRADVLRIRPALRDLRFDAGLQRADAERRDR